MENYRLWYLRKFGEEVQGPFPETIICQHILLGRIGEAHEVSQGHDFWRSPASVPEIIEGINAIIGANHPIDETKDPKWREERVKAVLRWIDERKSPDRRQSQTQAQIDEWASRRRGGDRRKTPETVEQLSYRENRAQFEISDQKSAKSYWKVGVLLGILALALFTASLVMNPVNPVKVDFSPKNIHQ